MNINSVVLDLAAGAGCLMFESMDPLTLEFLAWVSSHGRTYAEAMEVWQTTCPAILYGKTR
jgi:hypothetical protein